ncbi:MAG: Gfo/Idh/MocA family oxidoreductase [Planctomycetota bacterium]
MVRIGIVGIGFMGMIHYLAAKRLSAGKVTAIATRDPKKRAGDWTSIQGNFGPRGGVEDLANVQAFETAAELITSPGVDLVDICLPNDQHVETAIAALNAGKHVLVEKPIALSVADADRMVDAAQKANRMLIVAHVLPFFADFQFVLDMIQKGKHGKLLAAHFRRHISPPDWSAAIADLAKTGGPIVDLHIHDTHFIGLACGVPKQVQSRGILRQGAVEYVATQYLYEGGLPVVSATSGAISQSSRPFTHGYEVYLENATIHYEAGGPLTVYTADGVSKPELPSSDPVDSFVAELSCAVEAIQSGKPAPLLSGTLARDALALCLKEEESAKTGKTVSVK